MSANSQIRTFPKLPRDPLNDRVRPVAACQAPVSLTAVPAGLAAIRRDRAEVSRDCLPRRAAPCRWALIDVSRRGDLLGTVSRVFAGAPVDLRRRQALSVLKNE